LEYAICTLVDKRMDMSQFEGRYQNDDRGDGHTIQGFCLR
jgi:hypothetical protein